MLMDKDDSEHAAMTPVITQLVEHLLQACIKFSEGVDLCAHQFTSLAAAAGAIVSGHHIGLLVASGHIPQSAQADEMKMQMVVQNFSTGETRSIALFHEWEAEKAAKSATIN